MAVPIAVASTVLAVILVFVLAREIRLRRALECLLKKLLTYWRPHAHTGLAVQLPEWQYPVVCDTASGQLKYDNFNGRWGDPAQLDRFLQAYAVERARAEARRRGHAVTEAQLPDGSIKLTIQVQGGAA